MLISYGSYRIVGRRRRSEKKAQLDIPFKTCTTNPFRCVAFDRSSLAVPAEWIIENHRKRPCAQ